MRFETSVATLSSPTWACELQAEAPFDLRIPISEFDEDLGQPLRAERGEGCPR